MCSSSSPVRMRHELARREPRRRRRHVEAARGRLPGEARALAAERSRRLARRRQPADPVLEHRARGRGVRRREERQHEDVAVPEHVAAVRRAAEAARADGGLAVVSPPTPSGGRARSGSPAAARGRPRSRRRPPASAAPTPRGARASRRSNPASSAAASAARATPSLRVVGAETLEDRTVPPVEQERGRGRLDVGGGQTGAGTPASPGHGARRCPAARARRGEAPSPARPRAAARFGDPADGSRAAAAAARSRCASSRDRRRARRQLPPRRRHPARTTPGARRSVRRQSGAPRVPRRPSASVRSDSWTRSSRGSNPSTASVHCGSPSSSRDVAAAPALELVREDLQEATRPAAELQHLRRRPGRLDADREGRRPRRLRHEQERVAARQAAERPELVAGDQHEARPDPASRKLREHPARGVRLVREADLDVLGVARHPRIRQACVRRGRERDLDGARQAREPGSVQPVLDRGEQLARCAPSADPPIRDRGMRSIFRRFRRCETISASTPRRPSSATVAAAAASSAAVLVGRRLAAEDRARARPRPPRTPRSHG